MKISHASSNHDNSSSLQLNTRCRIVGSNRNGYVAYIGEVAGLPEGEWIGVHLDQPLGKNDGTALGERYFVCPPLHGVFIRSTKITLNAMMMSSGPSSSERPSNAVVAAPVVVKTTETTEANQQFWKEFEKLEQAVKTAKAQVRKLKSEQGSSDQMAKALDLAMHYIACMQEEAAKSSHFLPNYDIRQTHQRVTQCTDDVTALREDVLPRKKFSFRNRKNRAPEPAPVSQELPVTTPVPTQVKGEPVEEDSEWTIRDRSNEVIVLDPLKQDLGSADVVLSNLTNCVICIRHPCYALRLNALVQCEIYTGPISGSILMHSCHDCLFYIATRQLRIHDSTKIDFYVRIQSNPILEDCHELRFAPYPLVGNELEKQLLSHKMNHETGMWSQVNDFKWLKTHQSPNWSILPESERQTEVHAKARPYFTIPRRCSPEEEEEGLDEEEEL